MEAFASFCDVLAARVTQRATVVDGSGGGGGGATVRQKLAVFPQVAVAATAAVAVATWRQLA